ncbi:pilin [Patescibacteria group bacterium]
MKKILTILIILFFLVLPTTFIQAEYKLEIGIPGQEQATQGSEIGLEDYIRYVYLFALGVVGLAAFGAMVFGGFLYMASGTNITSQEEAKKWIYGAITGLVLGLASYLILNTINPNLVAIQAPKPPEIESQKIESIELTCSINNCPAKCETECLPGQKWNSSFCQCIIDTDKYKWEKTGNNDCGMFKKTNYDDSFCESPKPTPESEYDCCGLY